MRNDVFLNDLWLKYARIIHPSRQLSSLFLAGRWDGVESMQIYNKSDRTVS